MPSKKKDKGGLPSLVDEGELSSFFDAQGVKNAGTHAKKIVDAVFRAERKLLRRLAKESKDSSSESSSEGGASDDAGGSGGDEINGQKLPSKTLDSGFDIRDVKNLPPKAYELLAGAPVLRTKVILANGSKDSVTTKLLIKVPSGNNIESVVLRHNKRTTLCVSSQVGCKMGCTFCATGTLGERENLNSSEIQEQLFHANRELAGRRQITNIVFMGMGEPLNNYKAVVSACSAMVASHRFSLSPARVSVSTVGVIPRMRTLQRDLPGVNLALSLHAPTQELREKIIPTASAYPLDRLMDALATHIAQCEADAAAQKSAKDGKGEEGGEKKEEDVGAEEAKAGVELGSGEHGAKSKRVVLPNGKKGAYIMIEYILLHGVNDTPEVVEQLAELLGPFRLHVKLNLIPYNPIFNPQGLAKTFVAPGPGDISYFHRTMVEKHGIFCTVRTEMGSDVNGACGQLACINDEKKRKGVDIEDLMDLSSQAAGPTMSGRKGRGKGKGKGKDSLRRRKARKGAATADSVLKDEDEILAEIESQYNREERKKRRQDLLVSLIVPLLMALVAGFLFAYFLGPYILPYIFEVLKEILQDSEHGQS